MQIGGRAHTVDDAEKVARAGFSFAEISIVDAEHFRRHELLQLKHLRDRYGISYLVHGPEEGNAWEPELLRRDLLPHIRQVIDCAVELGVVLVTVHFWLDSRFIDAAIIQEKVQILGLMVDHARQRGIGLCIENLSEQPSDFLPVFRAIAGLGMTLDVGHAELLCEVNQTYGFSRSCFEHIRHLHVHDNRGGDTPADDLHLPPGAGRIDFATILSGLKRRGYDRTITLEIAPADAPAGRRFIEEIWNSM